MTLKLSQPNNVNVLISNADWAWPQAVKQIFHPQGFNALVANSADEVVRLVTRNKIHLAILDTCAAEFSAADRNISDLRQELSSLQTLKIIRRHDRLMPCLLLARHVDERILALALNLDVFSVLAKPVDLDLLAGQVRRIFLKYYAIRMPLGKNSFSSPHPAGQE